MSRPPASLPLALRILLGVFVTLGATQLLRDGLQWTGAIEGRVRLSSVALATACLYGAWGTWHRRRAGLDLLLLVSLLSLALLGWRCIRDGRAPFHPLLALAWAGALAAASLYFWRCRRRVGWTDDASYQPGSYQDWLVNPKARQAAADWFAWRDAVLESDRLTPPDPAELIEELLAGPDGELARHRLQAIGEAARAEAIAALDDPRTWRVTEGESYPPFEVLLDLIGTPVPDAVVAVLSPQASSPEWQMRSAAVGALARTATDACVAPVVAALQHDDPATIAAACEGLRAALEAGRGSAALRTAVLAPLVTAMANPSCAGAAFSALRALDASAALGALLAPTCWRADNKALGELLEVARIPLPAERAGPMFDALVARGDWYVVARLLDSWAPESPRLLELVRAELPQDRAGSTARVSALGVLVARREANAEALVRAAMDTMPGEFAADAATLLFSLHGLPHWPFPTVHSDEPGFDTQPTPVQHEVVIALFDSYVCNGGIVHGVECMTDAEWPVLDRALAQLAPETIATVLRDAFRHLAPDGLPVAKDARRRCIAAAFRRAEPALRELDRAYYENKYRLTIQRIESIVAHAALFRTAT